MMKEQIAYIRNFLEKAIERFPMISFAMEYDALKNTFIIEVKPFSQYSTNVEYGESEYFFTVDFEHKFPQHTIMFVSDKSLTKVSCPILEFGCVKSFDLSSKSTVTKFTSDYQEIYHTDEIVLSLAA